MKKRTTILMALLLMASLILTACWSENAIETDSDGYNLVTKAGEENVEALEGEDVEASEATSETEPSGKRIEPLKMEIDTTDPDDCTLPATFKVSDIDLDAKEMTFKLYYIDYYDVVDINMMQQGDTLVYDGKELVVDYIEDKSGSLAVNGGKDKGGCDLWPGEGGTYTARVENDYPTYSELGTLTLEISDALQVSDSFDNPNKPVETDMEGFAKYLNDMNDTAANSFFPNNTTIEISGGKVVAITRVWVP